MTTTFFQVQLSVQPKAGGDAEFILPEVFEGLDYHFVLVKDGGEEGLVKLDASAAQIKTVEKNKQCKKLSKAELESLKKAYPKPKLKQQYHLLPVAEDDGEAQPTIEDLETLPIDTLQTVRSGFYLIDVPIVT
jgi:hypothetical protein